MAYIRVSSDMQVDEGHSLASQEALIHEWCRRQFGEGNYVLYLERDEGLSGSLPYAPPRPGSTKFRPGLANVVERLRRDEVDFLVVYRLNRLFRDYRQQLNFIAEFFSNGRCKLIALADNLDLENIQGQLTANLLGVVSDYERKQIAQNLRIANAARRKDGYPNGRPPYGWRRTERTPGGRVGFAPCPDELVWVRRCFELSLAGWGIREIAREMQRLGAPPPGSTGRWDDLKVHRLLRQSIHAGLICHDDETHRGVHWEHRAVEPEEFERVQQGLESRYRERTPYDGKELLPLYNLGRCGSCGSRLRVVAQDELVAYRCLGTVAAGQPGSESAEAFPAAATDAVEHSPSGDDSACPGWQRSAAHVDSTLVRLLNQAVTLPEFVALAREEAQRIILQETHQALTDRKAALQQRLTVVDAKLDSLVDLYLDEQLSREHYDRRRAELLESQQALTTELRSIDQRLARRENDQRLLQQVQTRLWDLPEVWAVLTASERRQLVADLTEYVVIERTAYRHARLRLKVHFLPEQTAVLPHAHSEAGGYKSGVDGLTPRELALLYWREQGKTMREVAALWQADSGGLYRMAKKIRRRLQVDTDQEALELAREVIDAHRDELPLQVQARVGHQDWRLSQHERMRQVLDAFRRGLDRKQVAAELGLSEQSVRYYEWKAQRHYSVSTLTEAVAVSGDLGEVAAGGGSNQKRRARNLAQGQQSAGVG